MNALRRSLDDYLEAAGRFSPPARRLLLATSLSWTAHGLGSVLFNLYLTAGGFRESFVGRAISLNALGMALAALPAGWLADRWGRRRCLILGAAVDAGAQLARATFLHPGAILAGSLLSGVGQALLAIAAAPYLTEHSTPRERTHLFSTFFAVTLLAGVAGSVLGGEIPVALRSLGGAWRPDALHAFRGALWVGGALNAAACLPLLGLAGMVEPVLSHARVAADA